MSAPWQSSALGWSNAAQLPQRTGMPSQPSGLPPDSKSSLRGSCRKRVFFAELKAEDVTWQVEATDLTPAIAEDLLVRAAPLVTLYTYSARSASLGETEARSNSDQSDRISHPGGSRPIRARAVRSFVNGV